MTGNTVEQQSNTGHKYPADTGHKYPTDVGHMSPTDVGHKYPADIEHKYPTDDCAVKEKSGSSVLSRRGFVRGALGVSAAMLAVSGGALLAGCKKEEEPSGSLVSRAVDPKDIPVLEVSDAQIIKAIEFPEVPVDNYLQLTSTFYLPVGSLAHYIDSDLVLVLLPGEQGQSLRQIGLLDLHTGEVTIVVEKTIGSGRNVVIYDARASKTRLIWVEVDLGELSWKTYVAPISEGEPGTKVLGITMLVEEGSADYEPPMLAAYENKVYWTVMPMATGKAYQEDSYLRTIPHNRDISNGQAEIRTALISHGRMITNPLITEGIVTVVPRVDTTNIYYQLTALNYTDDKEVAYEVLPQSVRVSDAVYLKGGFSFSIENKYKHAGGISNVGTYRQLADGNYLYVSKPPTNAIVNLGDCLVVKSTSSIIGINPVKNELFILRPPQNCSDFGEALVGWGVMNRIILYSVRMKEAGRGADTGVIRVFDKIKPVEESAVEENLDNEGQ